MGTDDQAGNSGTVMVNLKTTATSISEFVCINPGKKEAKEAKEERGRSGKMLLLRGTISLLRSRTKLGKLQRNKRGIRRFEGKIKDVIDHNLLVRLYRTILECRGHLQS